MFNDLPEGAASHPEAPFNDRPPYCNAKSRLAPGESEKLLAQAIARMEAAGMKPIYMTLDRKAR